jgi:hypothetical protein
MTIFWLSDDEMTERAAAAYRRARVLVYDRLDPGEPVVDGRLSSVQREAITELLMAEADLSECRSRRRSGAEHARISACITRTPPPEVGGGVRVAAQGL